MLKTELYGITETPKDKIVAKWGNDFYLKILQEIEIYSENGGYPNLII